MKETLFVDQDTNTIKIDDWTITPLTHNVTWTIKHPIHGEDSLALLDGAFIGMTFDLSTLGATKTVQEFLKIAEHDSLVKIVTGVCGE